jgi:intein/homing endonuclease
MARITDEIMDEAEGLYKNGLSLADIGRKLGVSPYGTLSKKLKERGIKIIARNPAIRYTVDEEYFHEIDCEKKAYWLGFLMADGYVYQQKKRLDGKLRSRLRLTLSSVDNDHIKKFLSDIKSNSPINYLFSQKENRKYIGSNINESLLEPDSYLKSASTEINNKKIVDGLIKHGCIQNKSKTLEWPTQLPKNLERHFIRGYFDGDGSIFVSKQGYWGITICSASKSFIRSIQTKLKEKFIESSISNGAGCEILRIKASSYQKFYDYLYNFINVKLDRKENKFRLMLD